jgi:DNA-binding CsgD family transcriptional regulator
MPVDDNDLIRALGAIRDAAEVIPLREAAMRALALCGIKSAYFIAPLTRDMRVGRLLTNHSLPRVWERHYRARLYLVDPLPSLSLEYSNAFFWPDDLDTGALTRQQRHYLEIAAQYGLARGIGVACYGPQARSGFLGAAWTHDAPPDERIMFAVHQIGQIMFQRYCQIVRDDLDMPPLSNRELEVLGWMCRGKSNPDMAAILGVSRSTIDAYVRRIFAKLDVTDRTAACVRAYALGLIASEELERLARRARARDERES